MAKYDVTYKCGHTGTVELFGKQTDRDSKLEWYKNTAVCPDCYNAEKYADYEIIEMHYSEYKNNYADNKTVSNSYDKKRKQFRYM